MSEAQEFFAATVDEAVGKAASVLGVSPGELEVEVLDRGSAGFLGIGARDARIAVVLPPGAEWAVQANVGGDEELPAPSRDEGRSAGQESPGSAQPSEDDGVEAEEAPYDLILAVDEFMTALVEAMGFEATVDTYDGGDSVVVDVATKEVGLFIGQKGETIDAVQYLVNVSVYRERPFVKRIVVDSEGYRQRRIEAIQGMAHRMARRAVREQRPFSLPPMSAAERRVVHLFLQENPKVTTVSDGKDDDRRVIVSPL